MATKKISVQSPFLASRVTKDHLTRNSALDSAAMAKRNLSDQYLKFKNIRPSQFKGDPYSYGYKKAENFYDNSSTPLSKVITPDREMTYAPVTINNVAKVGADDINQYTSGAFKSIEPQYGEIAPNRQLNKNVFENYSIRFGKGGVAKKAIAEIQGILSRLPKGSAASQTKVASELEQAAAEKAALYTVEKQSTEKGNKALAKAKQTLSEPKSKKPLTKEQFQNQYVQHIDLRGREGNAEENAKSIMESGFRRGVNANAYTPFSGLPHRDVVSAKFQPQEGDFVYLAPKGQWVTTPNGVKIKEGFKPEPHEVIRVTDPNMSMYEHYLANFDKTKKTNKQKFLEEEKHPSIPDVLYHGTKREFSAFQPKYDDGLSFFSTNPEFAGKWPQGSGGLRANSAENEAHYEELRKLEEQLSNKYREEIPSYDDPNWAEKFDAAREKIKQEMREKTGFSTASEYDSKAGIQIMPVHLAIKKPFDPRTDYQEVEELLKNMKGMDGVVENGLHKTGNWIVYERPEVVNHLKSKGYDGMWLSENVNGPHETIAPFDSKQIKSAIGNRGTYDINEADITKAHGGVVHMGKGGLLKMVSKQLEKSLVKTPKKQIEAPTIIIPSKLSEVEKYVRGREGSYGADRVQYAADQIKNLERQYTEQGLKEAFSGDNARALMIGNPAKFQDYADRIERPSKGGIAEYKYFMSDEGGGADDVPFLLLDRETGEIPYVAGHEGRHRNLALEELGDDKTLWRMLPRAALREHLPRRSQEEYLDALVKEIGNPAEVSPEERKGVLVRTLPKMFLKGGLAHLAKGGVAHMAEGGQEFPLKRAANVTEADMTPTEVNPLAGTASRLLAKGNQYLTKPFGYENPPMEFVTDLLGVPDWIKTLENKAYGTPNYSGSGQATRLNEEAVDPLLSLIPVVGYTAKVGKKLAKKAAPYAANQAVNLMEKYGVSPNMYVVKPKGGNWMDVDKTVKAFKIRRPTDHATPEKVLEAHDKYWNPSLMSTMTEEGAARIRSGRQNIVNQIKVNNWIDKKLGNYIKNELATPEDSVRLGMERRVEQAKKTKTDNDAKLAKMKEAIDKRKAEGKDTTLSERDYETAIEKADEENLFANRSVSHLTAPEEGWALNLYKDDYYPNQASINKRIEAGYPEEGMSTNNQASKLWEDVSDYLVESRTANSIPDDSYMMKDNPWISKVADKDPNTPIYSVNANDLNTELEFRHMVDELQEAMSPTSVLPQNLRISEKDLEKMTVDDVSALSGKITAWRAAQKVKSNKDIANNPAMHTFKEYTENNPKGVKWQQIKRPEGYSREEQEQFVREATKYEGDLMRHCVGGAGHCEPLLNGEVEIYTLRDAKGEPHVTIEVDNGANAPTFYERNRELLEYPEIADEHQLINDTAENSAEYIRRVTRLLDENGYKEGEDYFIPKPKAPSIREIKGKGNQKPNDEYIPFVQDFIRSGQWDEIDDVKNTGMKYAQDALGIDTYRALKAKGIDVPQLITSEDAMKFEEMLDPNYFNNPKFTREDYIDNFNQTYAEGGLVDGDDNLMSLVDEHFLNQPIAFGLGGVAKKIAGKVVKSLEGQLDDSVEKLLDAHTAAKAKPKSKAKSNPDDKFLPLDLPRARRSKQEIQSEAERVSRQMMGEHVRDPRKPNDSANLADRSMAEVERLKGINYTLEDIKDLPEPIIIDPKLGDINIATVGDITVADKRLVDMNGYPIDSVQQGGPFFGLGKLHQIADEDLWWASEHQAAKNFQARVDEIANHFGVDRLTAQHYAMGQRANNFAMHFADANLKAINTFGAPEEGIEGMNKLIREGYSLADKKTGERKYFAWPDFPGVENIDEAYVYFRKDPEARKWFNDRMKKPTVTDKFGLPNGLDIQYAISDEVLRNMEKNLTGRSVGEVYRGSGLKDTANHGTYDTGIKGRFLGRSKYPTPVKLSYSDAYDYTAARKRPSDVTGTLQKVAPHQIVDDQYLNEIGEFNYLINKYTGKRKGGLVDDDKELSQEYSAIQRLLGRYAYTLDKHKRYKSEKYSGKDDEVVSRRKPFDEMTVPMPGDFRGNTIKTPFGERYKDDEYKQNNMPETNEDDIQRKKELRYYQKGGRTTAKDRVRRKMYDLDADEPSRMGIAPYGLRYALSAREMPQAKGKGYMGEMRGSEGVVTEYSLDDMDLGAFPSVTPNQPNENLDEINRGKVSHSTYQLAKKYAAMRKKAGKSAFAQMDELRYPQPQD